MTEIIIPFSDKAAESEAESLKIDHQNWISPLHAPETEAAISHNGQSIQINFSVKEKSTRSLVREINGPVWTDSCVEFFISPRTDGRYYNFEFNSAGCMFGGYGSGRDRELLPPGILQSIKRTSFIGIAPIEPQTGNFEWQLKVNIPVSAFIYDTIKNLNGLCGMGNFYKCGDLTPDPHYLSLWPVDSERPDFHRYTSFRKIIFE